MKKFVSVLLSFLVILGCLQLSAYAVTKSCNCENVPIVYVKGRSAIYENKNDPSSPQLPIIPDGYVEEAAKELVEPLAKGILTNNYSEYSQVLTQKIKGIYDSYIPDENGNVPGNTGTLNCPSPKKVGDIHKKVKTSTDSAARAYIEGYLFFYDSRLAPVDIADDLNAYIEEVKAVTGHKKVNIIARCMGACIASAYFAEYGWDSVNSVIIYNTTNNGTDVANNCFTGSIQLNPEALDHFASQELTDDTAIMDLLKASITMYNKTYGLTVAADILNVLIQNIAKEAGSEILRSTYGTMGGYWAMVGAEYYQSARSFAFPDSVADKYAPILAKFDEYYNNVSSKLTQLYTRMHEDGVEFNIITKYNYQLYPLGESSNQTGDYIITVTQQSFGATAADYGYCLSDAYINKAKQNGTDKYISADKIIDASTALFPDHTWFIKDLDHNTYPMCVDSLMAQLMLNPQMTVWDNEKYPQYLVYNEMGENQGTITPLDDNNMGAEHLDMNAFESIVNFFRKLFAWIKDFFSSQFSANQ